MKNPNKSQTKNQFFRDFDGNLVNANILLGKMNRDYKEKTIERCDLDQYQEICNCENYIKYKLK